MVWIKNFLTSDARAKGILGKIFKINTVWGDEVHDLFSRTRLNGPDVLEGQYTIRTPYMTTLRIAPNRFIHIFWRADLDPDWHDHMWDFHTFPLWPKAGYIEEVLCVQDKSVFLNPVRGWQWSFRPAEHAHRVVAPGSIPAADGNGRLNAMHFNHDFISKGVPSGWPVITYVVKSVKWREWGFHVRRDGRWCYQEWRDYVYWGGKERGCDPSDH